LVVFCLLLLERVDVGGALVPDMAAGVTRALPLDVLHDLQTTTVKTWLFLDDMGQAPIDVQSAVMRFFDAGYLSPHVQIVGATNRPQDAAGVSRFHEALRSRFGPKFVIPTPNTDESAVQAAGGQLLGTWADELAGWLDWAMDNGAAPEIIAWHRSTNGRTLYAWKPVADPSVAMPDFRTWGKDVITMWNAGIRSNAAISSVIGKGAAAEFLAFARLADELPTPDQVWMDPHNAPVPDDSSARYLIASMLVAAADQSHAAALVTYITRMGNAPNGRVYSALLARDAYRKLGAKLSGSREWVTWFTANQELFAVN
jgi:hypothetical protein